LTLQAGTASFWSCSVVCSADNHCLSLFLIESCCMQEDMLTAVLAFKRTSYSRAGASFEGYNCQHIPATWSSWESLCRYWLRPLLATACLLGCLCVFSTTSPVMPCHVVSNFSNVQRCCSQLRFVHFAGLCSLVPKPWGQCVIQVCHKILLMLRQKDFVRDLYKPLSPGWMFNNG